MIPYFSEMIAGFRYRNLCKKLSNERDYRLIVWRDLSISSVSSINPYSFIKKRISFPSDLVENYFVSTPVAYNLKSNGSVELDDIYENDSLRNLAKSNKETDRYWHTPYWESSELRSLFIRSGWSFTESKQFQPALRSFLNAYRVGEKGPGTCRNIATCLSELGDFDSAAKWFISSAEKFKAMNNFSEAADCFERAGLLWEALSAKNKRPDFVTTNSYYNSTGCFYSAKGLFAAIGEYEEASRCFVLEKNSHCKWSKSHYRRFGLKSMRFMWLYGESPIFALRAIFICWIAFAIGFMFGGFQTNGNIINYDLSFEFHESFLTDFASSLYFSAVTMSTLGYGDYAPASTISKALAGIEAFCGVLLLAMLLISIQRRFLGR